MADRFSCIFLSFNVLNIVTLDAGVWFTLFNHMLAYGFFSPIFSWGFRIVILTLSNQVLGSHSPITCWIFFFLFFPSLHFSNLYFSWGFQPGFTQGFHTLTLQPCFRFPLSMLILGLHSPTRFWILKFLTFFFSSQS